ncbi:glycosyltransferase family 2 protein [Caulobacter sp. S45]|uniref:glycosyltransferase family 2 protein n=1 Tax=Caulobacter sp. S45 TaxID=1641861 RepID=UPI00131D75DC|nr:glycosyltransferase family 2 protein [Caulobacter sp. S45]
MSSPASSNPVCVIIAAKDARDTIQRAVSSALAQPEAAEVVVVDDGSQDATARLALDVADVGGRLSVHRFEQNQGPAAARNFAMSKSRSPVVCVLDADDYMREGRLAKMLEHWHDCDLLGDDLAFSLASSPDKVFGHLFDNENLDVALSFSHFVVGNISKPGRERRELGFLKPLMSRSFLEGHGLRYDPSLRLGEDYILYASALAAGARMKLVTACGYVAVERPSSLSGRHGIDDLKALLQADLNLANLSGLTRDDRIAVRAHAASIRQRIDLREVLSTRQRQGMTRAVLHMLNRPRSISYILAQTVRDRMSRRVARSSHVSA